jgi:4-hydroxy-2-oxoheptanedioate aldolase
MLRRKSNPRSLREHLWRGSLLGTFVKLPSLEAIDIVAGAGFDFALVDREHSQLSEEQALRLVRHAHAIDLPAVVRIPSCEPGGVNRLLEAGAAGIQLSTVRSVEQVERLVAATRYPPGGARSVSLAHPVGGYGRVDVAALVLADPPLLVGQIETAETDDPLDAIFSAGLDVAFLGTTDLLVDVGFDRERLSSRIEEVAKAAAAAGVALGRFAGTASEIPEGARYVAVSSDVALLGQATVTAAEAARRALREEPDGR